MRYLVLLFLLISWTATETARGRVITVTDGDTITILTTKNTQEKIRLLDIDAPERNQSYYEKSRQFLSNMVAGKTVRVVYKDRDQYGRILGIVYVGRKNVNEEMIKAGLAWNYHYSTNKKYADLEAEAKRKKLNIFSERNPTNPYNFRNRR